MAHKIPAHLVNSNAKRIESHELTTAGPGMTGADIKAAREFLEARAKALGHKLAGAWSMERGEIRVWVYA